MADKQVLEAAGFNFDFNFSGLDQFQKILGQIQDMRDSIAKVTDAYTGMRHAMGDTGDSMVSSANRAKDSLKGVQGSANDVRDANHNVADSARVAGEQYNGLNDKSRQFKDNANASGEIRQNNTPLQEMRDRLSSVHDTANNVKSKMDFSPETTKSSTGVRTVGNEAENARVKFGRLKDVIMGSFVGQAIYNGLSNMYQGLKSSAAQGYKLAQAGDVTARNWKKAGLSMKQATGMGNLIGEIRGKSNISEATTGQMERRFYNTTGSAKKTKGLTNELTAYGSLGGMNEQQIGASAQQVARLVGSKTVAGGMFNRAFGNMPALKKQIQEASGLTTKAFSTLLMSGKMTGSQLEGYMVKASKTSGKAWSQFGKTTQGQMAMLKGTWTNMSVSFMAPFTKAVTAGLNKAEKGFGGIHKMQKTLEKDSTSLGAKLGSVASKAITWAVKQLPYLVKTATNLFKILKAFLSASFGEFLGSLKGVVGTAKTASGGLKGMAKATGQVANSKNVKAFQSIGASLGNISSQIAIGMWKAFASVITDIVNIFGRLTNGLRKSTGGLKGTSKSLESISKQKGALQTTGRVIAALFMTKKAVEFGKSIKDVTSSLSPMIGEFTKLKHTDGSFTTLGKAVNACLHPIQTLKGAFAALDAEMDANPIGVAVAAITALTVGVVELYKHFKPFRDFVNSIGKSFKKAFGTKNIKTFSKLISSLSKTISKTLGKVLGTIVKLIAKAFNSKPAKALAKVVGGVLGSAFKEIAKLIEGLAKIIGKVLNSKPFRAYAKTVKKTWGDLFKNLGKVTKSEFKVIENLTKVFGDIFTGHWGKLKKDIPKLARSLFNLVKSIFKGGYDWLNDLTGGRLGKMLKTVSKIGHDIAKTWSDIWNGIGDFFKGIWKWLTKLVHDGMKDIIDVLNAGIGGINWVISKFGGSKTTIQPIKFATGTGPFTSDSRRRAITRPTFSMLNDGHDSPQTGNRELAILPNGNAFMPKQRNWKGILPAGTEVLNAQETALIGTLTHFKKGTGVLSTIGHAVMGGAKDVGNWVGGAIHKIGDLVKMAAGIIKNPTGYLGSLIKQPHEDSTLLEDFASGFYNNVKNTATGWWSALWQMAKAIAKGGGSNSLLKYAEDTFTGAKYQMGAASKSVTDCSGMVMQALKYFGVSVPRTTMGMQHTSALKYIGKSDSDAGKGNIVLFGHGNGADGHVGITAGGGNMFNATPPKARISTIKGAESVVPLDGYYRVVGMKGGGGDDGSVQKRLAKIAKTPLEKSVVNSVGLPFFKWMSKHLSKLFGDAGGSEADPGGKGVKRWSSLVKMALKALHLSPSLVSKVLRQIATESHGDPHAMGGTDGLNDGRATGLMQVKPSTFKAYKVAGHGNIMNGYDNMLAGLNYAKHRYGKGLSALGNGHGYAKGGHVPANQPSLVGEHGAELFNPDTSGNVISHEALQDAAKGKTGDVHIDARTDVKIQNADSQSVNKLDQILTQRNDDLVKQLNGIFRRNGGFVF